MALGIKNPLMQIQSLGWEDPLGWKIATHSRILAWKTPWTEEPGGLQSMESDTTEHTDTNSMSVLISPYPLHH